MKRASVFCNCGNACSVHLVCGTVAFHILEFFFICYFNIFNKYIFNVIKKNCGRNVAFIYVTAKVEFIAVVLIPNAFAVSVDFRQIAVIAVGRNFNHISVYVAAVFQM